MANKNINQQTEDASPTTDDFLLMWDVTTGTTKKVSIENVLLKILNGGSSYAWQTWTPTFVNMAGGTLNYSKYIQIGKTVHLRLKYTFAGAGISGTPTFTLPVTSAAYGADTIPESAGICINSGASSIALLYPYFDSTTVCRFVAVIASGTYAEYRNVSSTVPHTIAAGSVIQIAMSYEVA